MMEKRQQRKQRKKRRKRGMQAVSNLPINAWLPLADLKGGKTAAGCRGKPSADW